MLINVTVVISINRTTRALNTSDFVFVRASVKRQCVEKPTFDIRVDPDGPIFNSLPDDNNLISRRRFTRV